VANKAVDALSRKAPLLTVMSTKVVGFKELKNKYSSDKYFGPIYTNLQAN